MDRMPLTGDQVALISHDGTHLLARGNVTGVAWNTIAVACDAPEAPPDHGTLLVVTGTAGAGEVAYASVVAVNQTRVTLTVQRGFRPVLERRRSARVPAQIPVAVRLAGGEEIPGTLLDLSLGGAAVHAPSWTDGQEVEALVLQHNDATVDLRVAVTATERGWDAAAWHHCRFVSHQERHLQVIEGVLAELTQEHRRAEAFLFAGLAPRPAIVRLGHWRRQAVPPNERGGRGRGSSAQRGP